jgi:hypothetical protein
MYYIHYHPEVLGTSPSIFGQSMASYVICYLADDVYEPDSCERMSKNLRSKMKKSLIKNEAKRMPQNEEIELDDFELDFIVHTIWHSRCAVTGSVFIHINIQQYKLVYK